MSVAPLRRGGALALIAGAVFLLGATLYQRLVLAPAGYVAATAPISGAHQEFGPFLAWASTHGAIDSGLRIVEAITFVLSLWLPGALGLLLWSDDHVWFARAVWLGRAAMIAFLAQIALTTVATPLLAQQYTGAPPASQGAALQTYIVLFAIENLLASVVGGGLLTAFLVLVSLRGSATGRLPGWLAYLGLATAGLLGVSALFTLFAPTQPESPTTPFAFLGLSLWLITIGILLLSVQLRPAAPSAPPMPAEASAKDDQVRTPRPTPGE